MTQSCARKVSGLRIVGCFVLPLLTLMGVPSQVLSSDTKNWVTTWATSPSDPAGFNQTDQGFENVTLRQIVHTSVAGERVRVRFSNVDGNKPLKIGAARVAIQDKEASVISETDREITFSGKPTVTISVGEMVLSDPVEFSIPAQTDLTISLFLPEPTGPSTLHRFALHTNYVSQSGNHTESENLENAEPRMSWYFLASVEVYNKDALGTVVAVGDSITDGAVSTENANLRYPDLLADRFANHSTLKNLGVANAGVGGNRLLHDTPVEQSIFGRSLLWRFERDVLSTVGITHAIVLIGINDVTNLANLKPDEDVTAEQMIEGFRALIQQAKARHVKLIATTILPFKESNWFSEEGEKKRVAINEWIRTSGEFDGVIDFEKAVRDPENESRFLPEYAADMLHPNDAGFKAMVESIDLSIFDDQ